MNTRDSLRNASVPGRKSCVYCGGVADTNDHAPPRCLLHPPLPSNIGIVTLPACQKCNNGFSFDENVVRSMLALISSHPHLHAECQPGGRLSRAISRDNKLREVIERSRQSDESYQINDEIFSSFQKVFCKTVQGLFFGLYERLIPSRQLELVCLQNSHAITVDQIIAHFRPSGFLDITDQPLSEIGPYSWHTREPICIVKMVPLSGGPPINRVFRLTRETPPEWVHLQPEIFSYTFVKCDDGGAVCIMELWKTLIVAVKTPWPDDRGPMRKGRKNPLSRDI